MKEGKQMKKRWMSLVLTVIMVLSLAGCGKSTELSSVSRDPSMDDGTVWFDEEAVALAGSVSKSVIISNKFFLFFSHVVFPPILKHH